MVIKYAIIIFLIFLLTGCSPQYKCQLVQNISFERIGNEITTKELIYQEESDFDIKIISTSTEANRLTYFYSKKAMTGTTTEFFFDDMTLYVYAYPNGTYKTNIGKQLNATIKTDWTCPLAPKPPVGCACECPK